jgi:hypothetical protein
LGSSAKPTSQYNKKAMLSSELSASIMHDITKSAISFKTYIKLYID